MSRIEPRTPNTAGCPDQAHEHRWWRRLDDTRGKWCIRYDVDADGKVEVSEEMLAQLLTEAGYRSGDAIGVVLP